MDAPQGVKLDPEAEQIGTTSEFFSTSRSVQRKANNSLRRAPVAAAEPTNAYSDDG